MGIRPEKEASVAEIKEKLSRAKSIILVNNKGLTVAQATKLRRKAREAGVEYRVAKNTLVRIAAQQSQVAGVEDLSPLLEGPTSFAFGYEDPVAPAKVVSDFIKEGKITTLEIKGGWLEGRALSTADIKALADLPSREVLLGRVLGGMQGPMYGFAGSLAAILRQFAYAVEALRRQREGAGAES
ncbi:MAG: 50S ribosomal protein L10 [Firmicutes bacterium]|nr:50S ribosomal protein L10 [Bacillota bacterium]